MADGCSVNRREALLLKECYELAERSETLSMAKSILRAKVKKLGLPENCVSVQTNNPQPESEMQIISEALEALSRESFSASDHSGFRYTHKINSLPESADKQYLLALLSLRDGTDATHRIAALNCLSVALSYVPDDPRFLALARILQDAESR